MKRYTLATLMLALTMLNATAMQQPPQPPKLSQPKPEQAVVPANKDNKEEGSLLKLSELKKYFNLQQLFLKLSGIFVGDENEDENEANNGDRAQETKEDKERRLKEEERRLNKRKQDVVDAIIEACRIGECPMAKEEKDATGKVVKPQIKVKHYFDVQRLRAFLKRLNAHYFEENAAMQLRPLDAVKLLKSCLRLDAVQKSIIGLEFVQLELCFDNAISYYEGNPVAPIEGCIAFDKLPAIFGCSFNDFSNVDSLKTLINNLLQRRPITQRGLIGCFKFAPLLTWLGYKNDIEELDHGFKALLSLVISFTKDQDKAFKQLLRALALADMLEEQDSLAAGNCSSANTQADTPKSN